LAFVALVVHADVWLFPVQPVLALFAFVALVVHADVWLFPFQPVLVLFAFVTHVAHTDVWLFPVQLVPALVVFEQLWPIATQEEVLVMTWVRGAPPLCV
jgi:hypothetical protein